MKKRTRTSIQILILTVIAFLSMSGFVHARDYDSHEGYVDEITKERREVVTDLTWITPPPALGPPLQQQIFDEKLTKDFRERYEQKFGRTEAERVYNSPNRFTYYHDLYAFKGSPQEEDAEKRAFANYMVKKLVEYHVENYAKSDPKVRPMWEAKEKFSQMKVQAKNFKMNARYDLVGGKADIEIVNPIMETKWVLDMKGSKVEEQMLVLGRPITDSMKIEGRYKQVEGIVAFIGSKTISSALSTNITVSTFTNDSKKSTRESLYLAGASYVF